MPAPAAPASDPGARAPDPNVLLDLMPLARTLGASFSHYDKDEVRARLEWAPGLCTVNGLLHGGAVMALADSTGGACAFLNLPEHAQGTTTVESKTNFLRGVREGSIEAVSRPLHVGRTVVVIETDVRDDNDRLVARVTQTQLVLT
jgi:1,4-dihydroxy-2-naphthoyl-CoA hydrolase